jgi:hypothetical protein
LVGCLQVFGGAFGARGLGLRLRRLVEIDDGARRSRGFDVDPNGADASEALAALRTQVDDRLTAVAPRNVESDFLCVVGREARDDVVACDELHPLGIIDDKSG